MKTSFLAILLLLTPLSVSGENEKPLVKKLIRAQSINRSAGLSVLILGPESVSPGTLVKLDASQTTGDTFTWKLAGGNSELYEVSDDGKKVYFASPTPGKYSFLLAVARGNGDKAPSLVMAEHSIVIQGTTPKPNDPVTPAPQPTDTLPAGKFGMARYTRDLINSVIPKEKRGIASGFSANYALVSSQLKEGTTTGLAAANAFLQKKNQATAGNEVESWKATVFVPLGAKLSELVKAGTLSTSSNDDLSTVFGEISLGFAAAVGN